MSVEKQFPSMCKLVYVLRKNYRSFRTKLTYINTFSKKRLTVPSSIIEKYILAGAPTKSLLQLTFLNFAIQRHSIRSINFVFRNL